MVSWGVVDRKGNWDIYQYREICVHSFVVSHKGVIELS